MPPRTGRSNYVVQKTATDQELKGFWREIEDRGTHARPRWRNHNGWWIQEEVGPAMRDEEQRIEEEEEEEFCVV